MLTKLHLREKLEHLIVFVHDVQLISFCEFAALHTEKSPTFTRSSYIPGKFKEMIIIESQKNWFILSTTFFVFSETYSVAS